MATVKVIDLIDRAEEILQDVTNTRWSQQTLLDYLNDAQREIVLYRPDANPVNASFTLAADSSKQTLPAAALRLMKVYKNLSPNKSSIAAIDRAVLDDKVEDWYEATGTAVEYYVYDGLDPKIFYVYPHTTASNATVELVYSSLPSEITISNFSTATDVIGLDDIYANAILDYMLYRAYLKDTEFAGDMQKAGSFLATFQNSLGVKNQVDASAAPRPDQPE
jgi:hypothetical protein|tara:strand:+ start:492 stop:1154 length:663 start_codon:yes stop_codon:yes gene_type:complete